MKIVYTKNFPFKGYTAINLFGLLFVRKDCKDRVTPEMITHETIHSKQMAEMLWIFFYLWYGIEYLIILIFSDHTTQNTEYHEVSFEEEAHNNENDPNYPETRKHYAWTKYLKINTYKKK